MKLGAPPIFDTAEEFTAAADAYFEYCERHERMPTVNGMAWAMGMDSRQTLHNYQAREGFEHVVKRARTRLEDIWEQKLAGANAGGTIFWLKNQGWTDRTEQEVTHKGLAGVLAGLGKSNNP